MFRKIVQLKIEVILKREKEYEFPEFLKQIRDLIGFTRKTVCQDTGISRATMLDLEHGNFARTKEEPLKILNNYYGLPEGLLIKKSNDYCNKPEKKTYPTLTELYPDICPRAA